MTLSKQEVFDKTAAYLLSMKNPAKEGIIPKYLTKDGRKCAVGYWIPETHPAMMEQGSCMSVMALSEKYSHTCETPLPDEIYAYLDIFWNLQKCHDASNHWYKKGYMNKTGKRDLKRIAKIYGLAWNFGDINVK